MNSREYKSLFNQIAKDNAIEKAINGKYEGYYPSVRELSKRYDLNRDRVTKIVNRICKNGYKNVTQEEFNYINLELKNAKDNIVNKENKINEVLKMKAKRQLNVNIEKYNETLKQMLDIANEELNYILLQVDRDKELLNEAIFNPNDLAIYKAEYRKDNEELKKQLKYVKELSEEYDNKVLNNPFND